MHFMCAFHINCSYSCFPVQIKLARLIVDTNITLTYIRYEAQLVLIIEIIYLNDQMMNIVVKNIIGTCGIRICQVCSICQN